MTKRVKLPNGGYIDFPDNVDDATISNAVAQAMDQQRVAKPAPVGPKPPEVPANPSDGMNFGSNPTHPIGVIPAKPGGIIPTPHDPSIRAEDWGPGAGRPTPATPAPSDLRGRTGTPQTGQRDYGSMYYLKEGMRVSDKGIEANTLSSDGYKNLTAAQRKTLDQLAEWNPEAPVGSRQNPFIAIPGAKAPDGRQSQPNGPVGSYKLLADGRLVQQETKYDDALGFTQETMRATDNVLSFLGNNDSKQAREDRANQIRRAQLTGVEPGALGGLSGGIIGTYPYVFATRNPYVGGAAGGALNTRGDTVQEVATDAAAGALLGKLFDAAGNFIGDTVAPAVSEQVNRLLKSGVKLTPGQIAGGAAKRVEDASTSIPLVGDLVSSSQKRAQESFNTAAINEALAPADINLNRMGPDELINRRAPASGTTPPPGTPARRSGDVPIEPAMIENNGVAIPGGTPGAKQITGPAKEIDPNSPPSERAAGYAARAKANPNEAGDDLISAELAHRDLAEEAAANGDMKLAKQHEDVADLYQQAYSAEDDAMAQEAMNKAIKGTEDILGSGGKASAPGSDRAVNSVVANVLAKVGIRLPAKVPKLVTTPTQPTIPGTAAPAKFGSDAVEWAYNQLRIKYNNLLQNVESNLSHLDQAAMNRVREMADELPGPERAIYEKFLDNYVRPRFKQNVIRGDDWKELDSALSQEIRDYMRSLDPNQRKLAKVYRQMQSEIREMFAKGVEAGRPAAPLPKQPAPTNDAVHEANLKMVQDHGRLVDEWVRNGKKGMMPKAPELIPIPDYVDAGFKRGPGGMAKPADKKFADELRAIDAAYANILRIEAAASKAPGGVFTAQGLRTVVREMDTSPRKRATAHGKAPMQQIAEDGISVLSRQVPESGTATRGLINAAAVAALIGSAPKLNPNPMLMAGLAAMIAPYTKAGGGVVRKLMTERPEWMKKLRPYIDKISDAVAVPAAGPTNQMLRGYMEDNNTEAQ